MAKVSDPTFSVRFSGELMGRVNDDAERLGLTRTAWLVKAAEGKLADPLGEATMTVTYPSGPMPDFTPPASVQRRLDGVPRDASGRRLHPGNCTCNCTCLRCKPPKGER